MDITQIEKIKKSLQSWIATVYSSEHAHNPKNLHIDEIETFADIKRNEWVEASFFVFKILTNQFKVDELIIFLHFDLLYSDEKQNITIVSLDWLKKNLDEFTPPSWHCTSLDYYNNFYKKQCIECSADKTLADLVGTKNNFIFLFRTYYDESEKMFSRELYVFAIGTKAKI